MDYLIKYTCYSQVNTVLSSGTIRAKRKENEFMAKVGLENFMRRKHPDFGHLVIHSCREDYGLPDFFNDIFGTKY